MRTPASFTGPSVATATAIANTPRETASKAGVDSGASQEDEAAAAEAKARLIRELEEQARNGGRRQAEAVQEEITLRMEQFRDKYSDMPI